MVLKGSNTDLTPNSTRFLGPLQALLLLRFRQNYGAVNLHHLRPEQMLLLLNANRYMLCRIGNLCLTRIAISSFLSRDEQCMLVL